MKQWEDIWDDAAGAIVILAIAAGLIVAAKVFPVWREFVVTIVPWALAITAVFVGILYFRSKILPQWQERTEERRNEEEKRRVAAEEYLVQSKKESFALYKQLRSEITDTKEYKLWRRRVLERYKGECAVCHTTENIEVDHRYKSFYKILEENRIHIVIYTYK